MIDKETLLAIGGLIIGAISGAVTAILTRPKTKAEVKLTTAQASRADAETDNVHVTATVQLTGAYEVLLERYSTQVTRLERRMAIQESYISSVMSFILEANNLTADQRLKLMDMQRAFAEKMGE